MFSPSTGHPTGLDQVSHGISAATAESRKDDSIPPLLVFTSLQVTSRPVESAAWSEAPSRAKSMAIKGADCATRTRNARYANAPPGSTASKSTSRPLTLPAASSRPSGRYRSAVIPRVPSNSTCSSCPLRSFANPASRESSGSASTQIKPPAKPRAAEVPSGTIVRQETTSSSGSTNRFNAAKRVTQEGPSGRSRFQHRNSASPQTVRQRCFSGCISKATQPAGGPCTKRRRPAGATRAGQSGSNNSSASLAVPMIRPPFQPQRARTDPNPPTGGSLPDPRSARSTVHTC
mmetsp:Transcript_3500/g.10088  ORF Transcript_3500/g.10088 Transcript_3500/m.10088 type:complete len:290 (-) Transcript_3500:896-1765(-)